MISRIRSRASGSPPASHDSPSGTRTATRTALLLRIPLVLLATALILTTVSPILQPASPASTALAQEGGQGEDAGDGGQEADAGAAAATLGGSADEDRGILSFFAEAGPMAKLVLGILVLFSLGSWAIIFQKGLALRKASNQSDRFLETFRKSARFSEVSNAASHLEASPMVGVFRTGYAEIDAQIKAQKKPSGPEGQTGTGYHIRSVDALERSLQRAVHGEVASLARGTSFLATTAAATPFIGLFGTVWGIMVAFGDIGATGSTSIVTVAPGIAEALVNTAAGLAAAIPALIAYNTFAQRLRAMRHRLEDFALEFLNLAERNFT